MSGEHRQGVLACLAGREGFAFRRGGGNGFLRDVPEVTRQLARESSNELAAEVRVLLEIARQHCSPLRFATFADEACIPGFVGSLGKLERRMCPAEDCARARNLIGAERRSMCIVMTCFG